MHIAVLLKVLKVDDNDASPFSTQQQEAFSRHFTRALAEHIRDEVLCRVVGSFKTSSGRTSTIQCCFLTKPLHFTKSYSLTTHFPMGV